MRAARLSWQSKAVSLVVLPFAAVDVLFQTRAWAAQPGNVSAWCLGLCLALGALAWAAKVGTPAAALSGAMITASLMYSTAELPFSPWRTALVPVLAFLLITSLGTRFGRTRKERLGTAEERHGRAASQVCANMGAAVLLAFPAVHIWMSDTLPMAHFAGRSFFVLALAALCEAAADTISSEVGQVIGGVPVMLTTLRRVPAGTDGGITLAGTFAGVLAAGLVAAAGAAALGGGGRMALIAWSGGVLGLLFDSLLGATLERRGWLNNDAVNFLSTISAAAAAAVLAIFRS